MKIGEFAKRVGVTPSKIRFYEERGLLPPAGRTANGYRVYNAEDSQRVAFIGRARALGFTLADITRFMSRSPQERRAKHGVARALETKLAEIESHLAEVETRRGELKALLAELQNRAR